MKESAHIPFSAFLIITISFFLFACGGPTPSQDGKPSSDGGIEQTQESKVDASTPKDVKPRDKAPKDVKPQDKAPKDQPPKEKVAKDEAPKDLDNCKVGTAACRCGQRQMCERITMRK